MFGLDPKQIRIGALVLAIMVAVIGYYFYTTLQNSGEEIIEISEENTIQIVNETIQDIQEQIIIHIAGEVKNPGIVKINEGARIADVIEKAGGLNKEADITNINLAYPVEDGQKIIVPKTGEQIQEYITEDSQTNIIVTKEILNKKVNLNKATSEELQTLEGIGESIAEKIIMYRKENGDFKQIEDLKNVPGIGDAKFDTIKDKISVK